MMNVSLFGTCTMKYHSRLAESLAQRHLAEVHPWQPEDTLQGALEAVHEFDLILRELSGMERFIFQPGGGADAAYTHGVVTREYWRSRGQLEQRNEIVTSIQAHPCNAATAAAAGFKVVTLMLEEDGFPSVDALRAAVSERTAALMINNPDDMRLYNPRIDEWVRIVKAASALAFDDHANVNGVMGKIRARELGFDACMFMLHKTFGAPKGGGGPAVGAYGCSAELEPFLPARSGGRQERRPLPPRDEPEERRQGPRVLGRRSAGRQSLGLGAGDGCRRDPGRLRPLDPRQPLHGSEAGPDPRAGALPPASDRLADGDDPLGAGTAQGGERDRHGRGRQPHGRLRDRPWWMSHEPWCHPEPFTPEAGEMWSKEEIDEWIAVVAKVVEEAHADPGLVRTAPHHQPIAKVRAEQAEDPATWAMTWRAYRRKRGAGTVQTAKAAE